VACVSDSFASKSMRRRTDALEVSGVTREDGRARFTDELGYALARHAYVRSFAAGQAGCDQARRTYHRAVEVRSAEPCDREAIITVVRDAFANGGRDGEEEVSVVRSTWARDAAPAGLDLVAMEGELVLGHVLAAAGRIGDRDVLGIAPLSVSPAHQGAGVGSALMHELLRRIESGGWPVVVILGSPEYYARFGFESAAPYNVAYMPVGPGDPHFQIRRLPGFDSSLAGEFRYCWELE
jgi:putative acetyltransferase